jgi:subtilisin family serine protease
MRAHLGECSIVDVSRARTSRHRRRRACGASRRAAVVGGVAAMLLAAAVASMDVAVAAGPGTVQTRVIVRLRDVGTGADVAGIAQRLIGPSGGRLTAVYEHAVVGFAAELPAPATAALARNPLVAAVTPDQVVSMVATDPEVPTGIDRVEGDRNVAGAPTDVDIAILDTGVVAHPELNVVSTVDCTPWLGLLGCVSGNRGSVHWHATHVAGIAAARDDGVGVEGAAPGARLWSVRVLDAQGSGSLSQLIQGIDWVTAHADVIDVANMSLGGAFSDATFDLAISNSVAAGVVYVVAAGNDAQDSAGFSPANHPDVLTVSALADSDGKPGGTGGSPSCRVDQDDTLADFSNFGAAVDVAAPGVCINSTMPGGGYGVASGTSMATPHAAGVAGRFLAAQGLDPASAADVANVRSAIIAASLPQAGPCGFTGDRDAFAEPVVFLNAVALGGDGTCGASGPADSRPVIDWTSPGSGAVVSGSVAVAAVVTDAEDPAASLDVQFRAGGGPWQPMAAGAGDVFSAVWDSTATGDGPVTLEIRATDSASGSTTASRGVSVDNVAEPPPTTMELGSVFAELGGKRNTDLNATVEVRSLAAPLGGAVVSGHFEVNGAFVTATATTGADGVAHLFGGRVRRSDFVTYFCVDGVTKPGLVLTTPVPDCVLVFP